MLGAIIKTYPVSAFIVFSGEKQTINKEETNEFNYGKC